MKKRMMKCTAATVLAAVAAALLTACAGGSTAETKAEEAKTEETTVAAESAAGESSESEKPGDSSAASSWRPEQAVEMVVPFSAGGSSDILARAVEAVWTKYCDQPVVITNIAGGGGVTGAMKVASAEPDGYTLEIGFGGGQDMSMPYLSKLDYDPFEMLDPVCQLSSQTGMVCTLADSEFDSLTDMVEWSKKNGQPITASVATAKGSLDLVMQAMRYYTGMDMKIVPHDSGSLALQDLLSGSYMIAGATPSELQSYLASGQIKILGVASDERDSSMPDVPTLKEQGIDFAVKDFMKCVAVPKNVPDEIKAYYEELFARIVEDEQFKEVMQNTCQPIVYRNTEEVTKVFEETNAYYKQLIEDIGLAYYQ